MLTYATRFAAALGLAATIAAGPGIAEAAPVELTGWNRDIVTEAADNPFAQTVGFTYGSSGVAWFESGAEDNGGTAHANGLPTTRTVTSDSGVTYQFQPYDGVNGLLVGGVGAAEGALTLATSAMYQSLAILAYSADGENEVDLTINFSDGSSANHSFVARDWAAGQDNYPDEVVLGALGRNSNVGPNGNEFVYHGGLNGTRGFGIFETLIDLEGQGQSDRAIESLTFTKNSGGGTIGIFAVSGTAAPVPEPASAMALGLGALALAATRRRR